MKDRSHNEDCLDSKPCSKCKRRIYLKSWYLKNKDKCYARTKRWRCKSPDKVKASNKSFRDRNPDKHRQRIRKWFLENPKMGSYYTMKRRAALSKATPLWAKLERIKEIYEKCPKGMQVDHIVPLKGKNVCGLHVHINLQYLTPSENSSKGNRFNPNMKEITWQTLT